MQIDRIHFYTTDAEITSKWFIDRVGFKLIDTRIKDRTLTKIIVNNSIWLVISSPLNITSPVARYLKTHPPGVVDIGFKVKNIDLIIEKAQQMGIKILAFTQRAKENFKIAKISGWDTLEHTLIETNSDRLNCHFLLDPLTIYSTKSLTSRMSIVDIDHVVLNVRKNKLKPAVNYYQNIFNFQIQQTFDINTANSGLSSKALIDTSGEIQFNINEPTTANSQIQDFIDRNGGSGIQHIAFTSSHIIDTVSKMRSLGVSFLPISPKYYQQLKQKDSLLEIEEIEKQQILIDRDRDNPESLLMQTFTAPILEEPTFFLELIQRKNQATGFGEKNFNALFEAVEKQQINY